MSDSKKPGLPIEFLFRDRARSQGQAIDFEDALTPTTGFTVRERLAVMEVSVLHMANDVSDLRQEVKSLDEKLDKVLAELADSKKRTVPPARTPWISPATQAAIISIVAGALGLVIQQMGLALPAPVKEMAAEKAQETAAGK